MSAGVKPFDVVIYAYGAGSDRRLGIELEDLLAERNIRALGMDAWHRIDAAEIERGRRHGRRRTTLAHRRELLTAAKDADTDTV